MLHQCALLLPVDVGYSYGVRLLTGDVPDDHLRPHLLPFCWTVAAETRRARRSTSPQDFRPILHGSLDSR